LEEYKLSLSFSKLISKAKNNPNTSFLIAIIVFALSLSVYMINIQINLGVPYWDVFLYLNNALMFAGLGEGYKIHLAPFISFLTSIAFRAGIIQESVIFVVDGIIFFFGIIGMYLLLKLRFTALESFAGAIIFSTSTIVLCWATTGILDVPGACLTILAIYVAVYGLKKDERALYLLFPLAGMAFLTRYTAGLMIIPLLFLGITQIYSRMKVYTDETSDSKTSYSRFLNYIKIFNKGKIKKLALGAFIGLLILLPFFGFFYAHLGTPFPFLGQLEGSVNNQASTRDPGYTPDSLYYMEYLPNYISSYPLEHNYHGMLFPSSADPHVAAFILLFSGIFGFVVGGVRILKSLNSPDSETKNKLIKISIFIISLILFVLSMFVSGSFVIPEVLFLILALSLYLLLKDLGIKHLQLDLMILVWFFTYIISYSFLTIKVDRYFVAMMPAMIYLLLLGVREAGFFISSIVKRQDMKNVFSGLLMLGIALCILFSSAQPYVHHFVGDPNAGFEKAANWLEEYDPGYQDKVVYSDHWPSFSWYLKMNVQRGYPKDYINPEDFAKLLQKDNVTYFISTGNKSIIISGYDSIYQYGNLIIFKRK
jgi:4-amino-4-deoxy-L-arabinose transferase-like glycosyltransferase